MIQLWPGQRRQSLIGLAQADELQADWSALVVSLGKAD
jgi:hypothetical protein